ncbi:CBS domain-containing protein [Vulcanisaeta thermophila]|uniref:CBS domain-containing protein n=1 Tax=Vulcanisaeta thermophila TaxID=867917 RepID=UPI000852DB9D|nr:CBS domain-containing protein [Vulcanisaeta thermophila]
MIVKELMTGTVITLPHNAELLTAVDLMVKHGFRHIPIIEGEIKVLTALGIINALINNGANSLRDPVGKYGSDKFLRITMNEDASKVIKGLMMVDIDVALVFSGNELMGIVTRRDVVNKLPENLIPNLRVHEVANKNPVCVREDASILDAMRTMVSHGIRRLLVTEGEKLVGILSVKDVLNHVNKQYRLRGQVDFGIPVSRVMSHNPITIDSAASLLDAVRVMRRNNIGSLPVTEKSRLLGLITEYDIVSRVTI